MKKSNKRYKLYISSTFNNFILNNNFKHFSTTALYLGTGGDKGKRKATEEDIARWEEEEASNRDIKKSREEDQEDQEEKEMEKAIQESKKFKKLNTNEEAGPSNYQDNIEEESTQTGPSYNPITTSNRLTYYSESDSSVDKKSRYTRGVEDQNSLDTEVKKNLHEKNPNDPTFMPELEAYIEAQKKELESVTDKLSNSDLSKGEHKWHEGRQAVIVRELDISTGKKEIMNAHYRNEQNRIAHLNDDEGLGKTPSPSLSSQSSDDTDGFDDYDEFTNSEEFDDSDDSDESGPSDGPTNPGTSTGPGNSGSNEPGPTGEGGSNESYRIIIPLFVLNFIAEIFEHVANVFFF